MSIKAGDRVLFTGNHNNYGNNNYISFFKENKVFGVVGDSAERTKYRVPSGYVLVLYDKSFPIYKDVCTMYMLEEKDVTVVPAEQYAESDQWINNAVKLINELKLSIPLRCKTEPTVSYMNRTFNINDRQEIETNHSYAMAGTWDVKGKTWTNIQRHYRPACCAFTKMTNDLKVWIPKIWLNYYGYTIYDFVEYLKFLSKCDIGFQYEFLGEEDLDELFLDSTSAVSKTTEHIVIGKHASTVYQDGLKGFYCVKLKGSGYRLETYMRFICLRYMYNMKYWTIPGHAMQIKKSLGALVSNWEALLLAHLHHEYYGYYCFVSQNTHDLKRPMDSDNPSYYINPYQKTEDVLKKLRAGSYGMNQSFEMLDCKYDRKELNEFFDKKDWLGLYNYTKKTINK